MKDCVWMLNEDPGPPAGNLPVSYLLHRPSKLASATGFLTGVDSALIPSRNQAPAIVQNFANSPGILRDRTIAGSSFL